MAVSKRKNIDPGTAEVRRLSEELKELRARLHECEDTLAAIRGGAVDAIVVSGSGQEQVFTLAGAENAYRVFVEAMDEGAITISSAGTVLFANKAAANLLARPLATVIGASIFSFIPESERSQFDAIFREARNHSGGRCELTLTRSNGDEVPVFVSASSCVEFGATAICMVLTDLSEQKRNERIVADGKLARLILSNASEPMAVCDNNGIVQHCNHAFEELSSGNPLLRPFDQAVRLEIIPQHGAEETEATRHWFEIGQALSGREFRGNE